MEDEQTQEAVLQYLSGKMNETEQRLFEQKLEDDLELAGAYRFQRQVYHGAALGFQKEKKQLLQEEEVKPRSFKLKKGWLWAAAVLGTLILIGAGILLNRYQLSQEHSQQLAEQAFQPFPDYLVENSRGQRQSAYPAVLEAGMHAYEQKQFKQAESSLRRAISQGVGLPTSRFYLGNAYLALDEPNKAIQQFTVVRDELQESYQQPNQWYLALAYLYADQMANAKPLLNQLAQSENHYQQRAQQLLQQLD